MSNTSPLTRSPELMSCDDTALLIVDVQGKLITLIPGNRRIVWNIGRLIDVAKILGVEVRATEQYPQGLGPTTPELAERLEKIAEKTTFSCGSCGQMFEELSQRGIYKILLVGIESHVCVAQTAMDLMTAGFRIYLAVDAVGSRFDIDYQTALRRLDSAGATLTTTEAAIFEWCEKSGTPEFKKISEFVKQQAPE